jgi:hypothetical protein
MGINRRSTLAVALPQLLQQLANPPGGAQFAGDVGSQPKIALSIEPARLHIRRQFAHRFGKSRENLLDLARSEPPFHGHARLPDLPDRDSSTALAKYRACG